MLKKSAFLALSLFASLLAPTAQATSIDMTPVIATVQGVRGLRTVALLQDARLQVVTQEGVQTRTLSDRVFNRVFGMARSLADAELVHEERENICYFFMAPESPKLSIGKYDEVADTFVGQQPVETLSALHCGMKKVTYPKESYDLINANELREVLIILALETLDQ